MATLQSLSDLGQNTEAVAPEAPKYVKKIDAQGCDRQA
jgi:small subunit ribosomal protein S9